jgi:FkbM family methyltransferase
MSSKEYKLSPTCQIPGLGQMFKATFDYKTDGTFIDVGAFDGYEYSNTFGLAEIGWKGLCIEASKENYNACIRTYGKMDNVDVRNYCIGSGEWVQFAEGGEYSTYNRRTQENAKAYWNAEYTRSTKTKTVTFDEVLYNHWTGGAIDLISIDVEGAEIEVLRSFTLPDYYPTMVIIEAHELHVRPEMRVHVDWINRYFTGYGYDKVYRDDCNSIFVRYS